MVNFNCIKQVMHDPIEDSGAEIPNQGMMIKSIVASEGEN
jgi:hypothetical protein